LKLELLQCVGGDELRIHEQLSDVGPFFYSPERAPWGLKELGWEGNRGLSGGLGVGILLRETAERSNLSSLSSHVFHTHLLKQSPCHCSDPVKILENQIGIRIKNGNLPRIGAPWRKVLPIFDGGVDHDYRCFSTTYVEDKKRAAR